MKWKTRGKENVAIIAVAAILIGALLLTGGVKSAHAWDCTKECKKSSVNATRDPNKCLGICDCPDIQTKNLIPGPPTVDKDCCEVWRNFVCAGQTGNANFCETLYQQCLKGSTSCCIVK